MVGFAETYFPAFAIFLGASYFQMGVLACLPLFLAGQTQFFTSRLSRLFPSRKRLVAGGVFLQAISLVPIFLTHQFQFLRIEFYIFFVTLYFTFNNTISPVWNSWMGDLVATNSRGKYFGKRNRIVMVGTFLSMIAGGAILYYCKKFKVELLGFAIILLFGFGFRLLSFKALTKKLDLPSRDEENKNKRSFFQFCWELPSRNYGHLILSMVTVNFGVYLAAAFYTPHLLSHLKLNYWAYTVMISSVLLFKSLASGFWGEVIDKLGAKRIVVATSFMIGLTTWPWAFSSNLKILFVTQCFTGIAWAGYELATFTFLLDATVPEERTMVMSYYNILNTATGFSGGVIGAIYVAFSKDSDFAFRTLFVATAVVRLISFLIYSPYLKEIRILTPMKTADVLLKASGLRANGVLTSKLIIFAQKRRP